MSVYYFHNTDRILLTFLALALVAAQSSAALDAVPRTRLDRDLRCLLGVYTLPAGRSLTITGVGGRPRDFQYTFSDGSFGVLHAGADGTFTAATLTVRFAPCSTGTLTLARGGIAEQGVNLRLVEKETTFTSGGVPLHGKLVLPAKGYAKFAAVWIEGSNNDPSTDDAIWQYELARRGVAVFVYDKRGTGASGGTPSSDFHVRARDTAAAVGEMRRLAPGIRGVGVIGGSQGGWVAPLTATLARLNFVIPAFAMAEGPIAQDRELVAMQLTQAGFGDAASVEARELTAITERIVRSNMRDGFAELDAFKARHGDAKWLKAIQPRSYTGLFLTLSSAEIKANGPALAQELSFAYEPRHVIETIKPRQLWLLGGSDRQAPNAVTQTILRRLQQRGSDIAVVVFPKADHGLIERSKVAAGGATAYSSQLFDVTADWIKTRKLPASRKFVVMPR